ncbi:MAG: nickel-dependent hydrogenase large subunit [archaeon]
MHDFVMPIGPQSPAMKEPMLIKLRIDGNTIKDVEMRLGYTHKGIEGLLEGKTIDQAMYIASRICGICSISHERAYIRTVEDMMRKEAPERVKAIRTVLFELERISSHILWAGYLLHEIGYDVLFQYFWREREKILDLFEDICGNRIHKNICKVGTLRYDMTDEQVEKTVAVLDEVEKEIRKYENEIKQNHTIAKRLEKVGVITKSKAVEFGLIGPNARASGVGQDIRKADPYDSYGEIKFEAITAKSGDSMDRVLVRIGEIYESIKIIKQCVKKMPPSEIPKFSLTQLEKGEGIGRVEAPRGELFYYVKVAGSRIERVKIRTPTLAYIKMLEDILKGVEIGDVPVIIASIDPCFSCMERVMVEKKGVKEWLTEKEFRRKYACRTQY